MVRLKAYAKINLNLHILPKKLKNNLYPIKYINCQINLFDEIYLENIKNKIILESKSKEIPLGSKNLVYKAASELKRLIKNKNLGVKIILVKNIPVKSGFGGGSSDAAVVLLALIRLWKLKVSDKELLSIAGRIGKEVYYCLKGGVCEVGGDGSKVRKIKNKLGKIWLVLLGSKQKKPSTGYMFKNINPKLVGKEIKKFNLIKKAILKNNKTSIVDNVYNEFERFAIKKYPQLKKIRKDLLESGAQNVSMTGAGLYFIGFFENKKTSEIALKTLRKNYKTAILTHTI